MKRLELAPGRDGKPPTMCYCCNYIDEKWSLEYSYLKEEARGIFTYYYHVWGWRCRCGNLVRYRHLVTVG